jgi:hypothetical protein
MAKRLKLPPYTPVGRRTQEDPTEFWERVEGAGVLLKGLTLYDQVAAEHAAWVHLPRETKKQFAERAEREGRRAEVERVRAELLASGLSQREAETQLVERFQPLDGSETRAWETPDPWEAGRLFRNKADQTKILQRWEKDKYNGLLPEAAEAKWRLRWAKHRQEERFALAAARRRARALNAAATNGDGPKAVQPSSQPVPSPVVAPVPATPPAAVPAQREERQLAEAPPCRSPAPTNGEARGAVVCPPPPVGQGAAAPDQAARVPKPPVVPGPCELCGGRGGAHARHCKPRFVVDETPEACDWCKGPVPPEDPLYCAVNTLCPSCREQRGRASGVTAARAL